MEHRSLKQSLFGSFLFIIILSGCVSENFRTGARIDPGIQPINYAGLQVSVAVSDIINRTGVYAQRVTTGTTIQTGSAATAPIKNKTYRDPIGGGMRDQLITSLTQTGAFTVSRNPDNAQYFLEGAVTEYEPSQASIAGGYGWGGRLPVSDPTVSSGFVFAQILAQKALGGFGKQDHIALNIHLVDRKRDVIVASTTVEAKPKDLGLATNLLFGGRSKMIDLGAQSKTPMQKAIRACMMKTAVWAANTLQTYQNSTSTSGVRK